MSELLHAVSRTLEQECPTDLMPVFLDGGPLDFPLPSRSFCVSKDLEIIRIRYRGGYECYKRSDRQVYFVGDRCRVFEWNARDEITSPE